MAAGSADTAWLGPSPPGGDRRRDDLKSRRRRKQPRVGHRDIRLRKVVPTEPRARLSDDFLPAFDRSSSSPVRRTPERRWASSSPPHRHRRRSGSRRCHRRSDLPRSRAKERRQQNGCAGPLAFTCYFPANKLGFLRRRHPRPDRSPVGSRETTDQRAPTDHRGSSLRRGGGWSASHYPVHHDPDRQWRGRIATVDRLRFLDQANPR
jgi:hypothetical protein